MNNLKTERINIWEENCRIRFGAIDRSNCLTLAAVFNFFQEAAISHAENLGAGRDALACSGRAWILSRMSVEINERPQYGETVTVCTWPRGGEKLFAFRNYEIRNSNAVPLIQAKSRWLIMDIEKRRPLRPQAIIDELPLNEGADVSLSGNNGACALSEKPNLQKTAEHKALYSDIDYNGHVNNVSYIRWIEDAVDSPLLEQAARMRLDINYLSEILPGETAEIWSAQIPGENAVGEKFFAFEGRKQDGFAAFRAELRLWQER